MSRYYGPFMLDLITLWNAVLFENKWMSYTPLQREETGNEQKGSRQKQFICHGSTSPTSLKVENMLLLRKRRIWWRNQKEKKTVVKVVHNDASVRTHPLTEEKRKMEKTFWSFRGMQVQLLRAVYGSYTSMARATRRVISCRISFECSVD